MFYRFPEVYEGGRPKLGGLMDPRQGAVDRQSRFQLKTRPIYDIITHLLCLVHLLHLTRVTSVKSSRYHHSAESHQSKSMLTINESVTNITPKVSGDAKTLVQVSNMCWKYDRMPWSLWSHRPRQASLSPRLHDQEHQGCQLKM